MRWYLKVVIHHYDKLRYSIFICIISYVSTKNSFRECYCRSDYICVRENRAGSKEGKVNSIMVI